MCYKLTKEVFLKHKEFLDGRVFWKELDTHIEVKPVAGGFRGLDLTKSNTLYHFFENLR